MKSSYAKRQHGAALLAMLAVLALGASWYLVSRLNADSGVASATRKVRNAEVLNRAKQALIGYVATQAAEAGERNPGRLPCPEHAWYIGRPEYPDKEGIAGPSVGVTNPGSGIQDCASIGRLPWITLGLEKLVDATGEPLWYVVGPSWRLTTSTSTLLINSNTPSGDITVDGQQTVALIIAPGAAMNVQASGLCTARNQARSAPSPNMLARDYIECSDFATSPQFVTTAASTSFNDQVIRITTADIMPAIEAAIANRIEREIVPALKTVHAGPSWGLASGDRLYPFAAPFASPATSAMQGASGTLTGLLPATYSETFPTSGVLCTPGVTAPRCDPNFVSWSSATMSGASIYSQSCTTTATQVNCTYYYICPLLGCGPTNLPFTLVGNAANVAMAMRQLNSATSMTNVSASARTVSGTLSSDGSATISLNATATAPGSGAFVSVFNASCGLIPLDAISGCLQSTISVPITLVADHPILDSRTASSNGWFVRNKWHEVTYYAVVSGYTPTPLPTPPSCTDGSTCLTIGNLAPTGKQRAILILAGRSINGSARPSATPGDYLEFGNATAAYERRTISASNAIASAQRFNDRIVVIDSN